MIDSPTSVDPVFSVYILYIYSCFFKFFFIYNNVLESLCAPEDVTHASEGAVQRLKEKSLSHCLALW